MTETAAAPTTPAERRTDWFTVLLCLMLLAACVEIVLLIRQNRSLKAQIASLGTPREQGPAPGEKAARISGVDVGGKTVLVDFGTDPRSTVLCVFSTTCPACNSTLPIWKETVAKADPTKVRAIAVTWEDPAKGESHLREAGLMLPVLQVPHDVLSKDYKMSVIPLTILIGADGSVVRTYPGVLEGDGLTDIKQRLGL